YVFSGLTRSAQIELLYRGVALTERASVNLFLQLRCMTKSALRDGPLPRGGNGSRPVASSETAQASGGGDGDVLLEFVDGLVRADDLRTSAGVFDLVGVLLLIGRIGDPAGRLSPVAAREVFQR